MATFFGDIFNNTFTGTYGDDDFDLFAGQDSADGGAGNDILFGGSGDDNLEGGADNDTLYGGSAYDILYGGSGNDTLFGDSDFYDDFYGGAGDDTIYGGDGVENFFYGGLGNDEIFGGSGGESLEGNAGNDRLFAGDGADTVLAGDGNDTIWGGAGADTLTLGAGNDTAIFDRFGGADIVTDFDVVESDFDGFYNDQLDVSDLRTLGGAPITTADVTPVDIGGGNVRLDFPEGESITLQGVSFAQMSSFAQLHAAGIPCFTAGTCIATPNGEVPVETLKPGDKVLTRDNGFQAIKWVGSRALDADAMRANPKLRPVRFAPGAFANTEPVLFSQQHGVLLRNASTGTEHLVRAVHLAKLKGGAVRIAAGIKSVTYVHLLFDAHQIVLSGGIWSESFYPGPWALRGLDQPQMQELATLFPELFLSDVCETYGNPARRFPAFSELRGRADMPHI